MRIGLWDKLRPYPFWHRKYILLSIFYQKYTIYLWLRFHYIKLRFKQRAHKTVVCYPEDPNIHTIWQICQIKGFTLTKKLQLADTIVYYEDKTIRMPDRSLQKVSLRRKIINYHSRDISKQTTDKIHKEVFGYGLTIDPQTFKGKYVKKSNTNSLHDGEVITYPQKSEKGYVYQLVVNNQIRDKVVDIRVPVIGDIIPFVYLKYRPVNIRFKSRNNYVKIAKVKDILSSNEYQKIITFCRKMGVDYGELDVLRDKDTKKIYIVDINNTPGGEPNNITQKEFKRSLQILADTFEKNFMSK